MVKKAIGLRVVILPLAIAFVVMFAVLFVKPAYDKMKAEKENAAAAGQQLENLQKQNAKLTELKSKWETMEEKKLVQGALPNEEDVENYMSELYERVSRSGALLSKFEIQESRSSKTHPYLCGSSADAAALAETAQAPSDAGAEGDLPVAGATPPAPTLCANSVETAISATGSWEQILDLFKYMEDTNRVANIEKASIRLANQTGQEGGSGDLLNADMTLNIFYKPKSETGNAAAMSSLASGGQFDEETLEKLESLIFAAFEEPGVSEVSERNIFK